MPVGRNFLEVVAPIEENTAGGRYLDRRQGDGGYMVITQADSKATQMAVRQNATDYGVRVAHETQRGDWHLIQLHPGDLKAAFFEIESDAHNDFDGYWHPVGGLGWEDQVKQDVTVDFKAVELQSDDPVALAELWGNVVGVPIERADDGLVLPLNNAELRFVEASDGRGPGLGGLDVWVADRDAILAQAKSRGCYVSDTQVNVGGVRWYLYDA